MNKKKFQPLKDIAAVKGTELVKLWKALLSYFRVDQLMMS